MLECSTCLRRCIRTVFADILPIHPPLRTSNRFLPKHPGQTTCLPRGYNTDAIPFEKPPPRGPPGLPPLPTRYVPRSNRPEPQEEPFSKSSLELELRWLKDPMKLAKHTVELLKGDQQQKALAIVRLASRDVPCTVSWNHLVDYEMGKGRVANGVKLYNEVRLPYTAMRSESLVLTTIIDEEACPNARCLYLYDTFPWPFIECSISAHRLSRAVYISFYVHGYFPCETEHHPHQCRPQGLRFGRRYRRSTWCCCQITHSGPRST